MTEPRRPRPRTARVLAGALAVSVGVGATLLSTAAPAAAEFPRAQAVGRFLDGAAGGSPIQSIVDLHDARATNPGTVSDQNPFDITVGGQGDIPLSHKLQLPGSGNAFHVGAANQVAAARSNGYSLGASGAVGNQGGISAGGQNGTPANATLDLSGASFPTSLPIPGSGGAASLGGITASIGAVSARAHTPPGVGVAGDTNYNIGSFTLTLGSPALGGVLAKLGSALTPPDVPIPGVPGFPKNACSFKVQALSPISIASGAITIDPSTGSITIDVAALLRVLGLNLNALPANTDLLGYVLNYLGSANGLAAGLQGALADTFTTQKQNFETCLAAIGKKFPKPLDGLVKQFFAAITSGQTQLTNALNGAIAQIAGAGGKHPFAPLVTGLKQALQIGVNVQPNGPRGTYQSPLKPTPDQATPVVAGQTIVRAIEIDLGGGQGVSLALANAAAGPSSRPTPHSVAPKTPTPAVQHNHRIPTGIPAGQGPIGGGSPQLPLVLLVVGLALAAAGGASGLVWKLRPRRH